MNDMTERPRKPVTLDERAVAALERIANALEELNGDGGHLDRVVGRLDDIENAILQAGSRA